MGSTARSVEDETRNGGRNANGNPKRNQATTVLWLFSKFQVKRDLDQSFHDSDEDFVLHCDDHFESHLLRNALYQGSRQPWRSQQFAARGKRGRKHKSKNSSGVTKEWGKEEKRNTDGVCMALLGVYCSFGGYIALLGVQKSTLGAWEPVVLF